jgi:hypothetical protein
MVGSVPRRRPQAVRARCLGQHQPWRHAEPRQQPSQDWGLTVAIAVGQLREAQTERSTRVVIEITRVDKSDPTGCYVWGHRQYRNRRTGIRHAAIPNLYFIPKSLES